MDGSSSWLRVIAGPASDGCGFAGVDAAGRIVTTGTVTTAADFGGGLVVGSGMFIAEYGSGGAYSWATLHSVSGPFGLDVAPAGGIVLSPAASVASPTSAANRLSQ